MVVLAALAECVVDVAHAIGDLAAVQLAAPGRSIPVVPRGALRVAAVCQLAPPDTPHVASVAHAGQVVRRDPRLVAVRKVRAVQPAARNSRIEEQRT